MVNLGHAVELVQGGVPGEGGLGQVRAVVVVQHLLLDGSHTAPEVLLQHNSTSSLGRLVGLLGALHAHLDYVAIEGKTDGLVVGARELSLVQVHQVTSLAGQLNSTRSLGPAISGLDKAAGILGKEPGKSVGERHFLE